MVFPVGALGSSWAPARIVGTLDIAGDVPGQVLDHQAPLTRNPRGRGARLLDHEQLEESITCTSPRMASGAKFQKIWMKGIKLPSCSSE